MEKQGILTLVRMGWNLKNNREGIDMHIYSWAVRKQTSKEELVGRARL